MKAITTLKAIEKYDWPKTRTNICEITLHYDCNARCIFCYSSPQMTEWKTKPPMPLYLILKHMKDSYRNGSRIIQFIGGEPSIYPEIENAIIGAKKIGFKIIQMVTNGQKMSDPEFSKKLFRSGLNSITFSVHSHNERLHDKIVGIKGAFRKTIKAIENAIENGVYITISTAITIINYKDILLLVKFLNERYGIETYNLIATHFIGLAGRNKDRLKLKYSQMLPYLTKTIDYLLLKNALPISPILSNIPPCVATGYEDTISDWKIPFSDDDMYLPEKSYTGKMYTTINSMLKMKQESCKLCIYSKICAGFEKEYFKTFGGEEFKPIKKPSRPKGINCFYRH
ncbi:MAG: radical SAM protein [Elusimicrobiota bacterium]